MVESPAQRVAPMAVVGADGGGYGVRFRFKDDSRSVGIHDILQDACTCVVARVSAVCAELNINIEDITQSILQDMFCMIMLVDISACASEPAEIRARFDTLGQEMGMQVTVTRQEVFDAMHKV